MQYQPSSLEPKWQDRWESEKAFRTPQTLAELGDKPKCYVLDMFPYPSGAGLHVGHPEGYTATDIYCRYKRAKGFNVLHPMGWDAFGLPAERAAVRENLHPAIITKRNVDNFRKQIRRLGFSYDWDREVDTSSADYYRWTQWIFLKLYDRGLAYLADIPVNWCPALSTVLANEEVKDGVYVETGDVVEKRIMKQWMLRITSYAERLLTDLDDLQWPEPVKEMQRYWIGKSEGALVQFGIQGHPSQSLEIFTTRPDTLFGATYCVLAPEHPLVAVITSPAQKQAVRDFVEASKKQSDADRSDSKTGVFTGGFALHPLTKQKLPIWIADYVLMGYGTGAIMAVPGHDERDHAFAKQYELPILEVVCGGQVSVEDSAFTGEGKLVQSDFLNGMPVAQAKEKMIQHLEKQKLGQRKVQYRLRDWLFSRQRYWGEPFPLVHLENGEVVRLPDDALPVELPPVDEYKPTEDGKPPLGRAGKKWLEVTLPDGRKGIRETNTMPQWAGSCWYYLRYLDAKNARKAWEPELEKYWMPVDLYIGGVEHAVLHLLYSRFWHKVLFDCGLVSTKEPFQGLFNQGMILSYSYQDARGKYFHPSEVRNETGGPVLKSTGEKLKSQVEKMSKSKNNVVNPDDVIDQYGADALRLYEMFMGPLDATKPWQTEGVEGVYRFLSRVWRLAVDEETGQLSAKIKKLPGSSDAALWKLLHQTIKKVSEDIEGLHFNTGISQMMIFVNEATKGAHFSQETLELFLKVLAPYAPHLSEEIWERLGHSELICREHWPIFDPSLLVESTTTLVLMINGKKRGDLEVPKGLDKAALEKLAFEDERIQRHLDGKKPKKVIVVPDKLVNVVVG